MLNFQTNKVKRFLSDEGVVLQLHAPLEKTASIDAFLARHVNGTLDVTIKKPSKKRTITANNYLWHLCDEIAKAVETDKNAVYRALIRRVGVFDYVLVKAQAADRFRANWDAHGLGWFTEEVLYKEPGARQFMAYYGTSVYTRDEISRVIDEAEQESRQLGLDTMTKKEKEALLESWAL